MVLPSLWYVHHKLPKVRSYFVVWWWIHCFSSVVCGRFSRFIVVKLPSPSAPAFSRPTRSPFFPPQLHSHVTTYTVYKFYPLTKVAPSASPKSSEHPCITDVGWVSYRTLRRWTMAREGVQFFSRRRSVGFSPAPSPLVDAFTIPHLSLAASGTSVHPSVRESRLCVFKV